MIHKRKKVSVRSLSFRKVTKKRTKRSVNPPLSSARNIKKKRRLGKNRRRDVRVTDGTVHGRWRSGNFWHFDPFGKRETFRSRCFSDLDVSKKEGDLASGRFSKGDVTEKKVRVVVGGYSYVRCEKVIRRHGSDLDHHRNNFIDRCFSHLDAFKKEVKYFIGGYSSLDLNKNRRKVPSRRFSHLDLTKRDDKLLVTHLDAKKGGARRCSHCRLARTNKLVDKHLLHSNRRKKIEKRLVRRRLSHVDENKRRCLLKRVGRHSNLLVRKRDKIPIRWLTNGESSGKRRAALPVLRRTKKDAALLAQSKHRLLNNRFSYSDDLNKGVDLLIGRLSVLDVKKHRVNFYDRCTSKIDVSDGKGKFLVRARSRLDVNGIRGKLLRRLSSNLDLSKKERKILQNHVSKLNVIGDDDEAPVTLNVNTEEEKEFLEKIVSNLDETVQNEDVTKHFSNIDIIDQESVVDDAVLIDNDEGAEARTEISSDTDRVSKEPANVLSCYTTKLNAHNENKFFTDPVSDIDPTRRELKVLIGKYYNLKDIKRNDRFLVRYFSNVDGLNSSETESITKRISRLVGDNKDRFPGRRFANVDIRRRVRRLLIKRFLKLNIQRRLEKILVRYYSNIDFTKKSQTCLQNEILSSLEDLEKGHDVIVRCFSKLDISKKKKRLSVKRFVNINVRKFQQDCPTRFFSDIQVPNEKGNECLPELQPEKRGHSIYLIRCPSKLDVTKLKETYNTRPILSVNVKRLQELILFRFYSNLNVISETLSRSPSPNLTEGQHKLLMRCLSNLDLTRRKVNALQE